MTEVAKPERTLGIYLVILYMVMTILTNVTLFIVAPEPFLNYLNVAMLTLIIVSIVGLWLMKKWGIALAGALSGFGALVTIINVWQTYTLHEEVPEALESWWWPMNAISLVLNVVVAIYTYRLITQTNHQ